MLSRRAMQACAAGVVVVALSSCGGGGGSGDAKPSSVSVTIEDGKLKGDPPRVKVGKGARVDLTVTSDTAGTVHVHGIDQRVPLRTGGATKVTFVASFSGKWDIEVEETNVVLATLEVGA